MAQSRALGFPCPQRGKHPRIGAHAVRFQQPAFNDCAGGNQKHHHFALPSAVPGGRVTPAMNRPPQGR